MFHVRAMFVAALVLTASCTKAPPSYYDSLRLVSAMREDELMLFTVKAAKPADPQDAACLARYEFHELTDIAARQINEKMTAAEVEEALTYFQGPAGHRMAAARLEDAKLLTTADQAELDQFKQSAAGRKLFQDRITSDAASMAEATARFDRHVEDCVYQRTNEPERFQRKASCKSKSFASADNVCLANYAAEGSGKDRKASVAVECRNNGKSLFSNIDLQPQYPIALRWSPSRELEVLIQNDRVKIISSDDGNSAQRFRLASRTPSDPPVVECLPYSQGNGVSLPLGITMAAWRAHRRPDACFMSARVPKEAIAGADQDVMLQFRRHEAAVLPYGTTELALIVELNQRKERPAQVKLGTSLFALAAHSQVYMLTGKDVEAQLQGLASQPGQVTVQPEGAAEYSIPLSRQDFDFAYADFSACLKSLEST